MLDALFADWVQVQIETGHDPCLLNKETFLHDTGLSHWEETPRTSCNKPAVKPSRKG
jgi:hypothetical protein